MKKGINIILLIIAGWVVVNGCMFILSILGSALGALLPVLKVAILVAIGYVTIDAMVKPLENNNIACKIEKMVMTSIQKIKDVFTKK